MKQEDYNQFSAQQIADLIFALRAVEAEGLRKTKAEQSFILRNIDSEKLVDVAVLLKGGLAAVLSGKDEVSRG